MTTPTEARDSNARVLAAAASAHEKRTGKDLGLELGDVVHDTASSAASDVNNRGLDGQIEYLVAQLGERATREILGGAGVELPAPTDPDSPANDHRGVPTDEQALALARLMRRFNSSSAHVTLGPFDLPADWIYVVVHTASRNDFHAGIAPDGATSS